MANPKVANVVAAPKYRITLRDLKVETNDADTLCEIGERPAAALQNTTELQYHEMHATMALTPATQVHPRAAENGKK